MRLCEDASGVIRVLNNVWEEVYSAQDMVQLLKESKKKLAIHATDVNATSSRSHCVLKINIMVSSWRMGGCLTMIDCAGTERKEDSMHHTVERRRECSEINSSLHALKECFRAMAKGSERIPFRGSTLTKVLMESFSDKRSNCAMVATLSPTPTDIEHSVSTLRTVANLAGLSHLERRQEVPLTPARTTPAPIPPSKWTVKQVREWLQGVDDARYSGFVPLLPAQLDGKTLSRWNVIKFVQICDGHEGRGTRLYKLLREEMDRVNSTQKLSRDGRRNVR